MVRLPYGKAICYSGYRKGQNPKGEVPSAAQIEEDLNILAEDGYRYLRMYDPNLHAQRVLETIKAKNLPLTCIIGIDSDPEVNNANCPFEEQHFTEEELQQHRDRNDAELDKLIALVKEFPEQVVAVSVGNENTPPWGAHMVSEERLIEHVRKLREELSHPVTFCEGYFEWPHISRLGRELDIISVHSYPYHYGTDLSEAVLLNKQHYADINKMYPDKQVIFTELGWSSNSPSPNYQAVVGTEIRTIVPEPGAPRRASIESAKRYLEELTAWLEEEQVVGFVFEAFDELWKGSTPDASECNFGIYNEDREKKW